MKNRKKQLIEIQFVVIAGFGLVVRKIDITKDQEKDPQVLSFFPLLIHLECILLTKKVYSVDKTIKSNRGLTDEQYKIKVKEVIMKLAENYNHYDKSRKLYKVLLEDLDPEFDSNEKPKTKNFKENVLNLKKRVSKKTKKQEEEGEEEEDKDVLDESNEELNENLKEEMDEMRSECFNLLDQCQKRILFLERENTFLKTTMSRLEEQISTLNQKMMIALSYGHDMDEQNYR